MDLPQIDPSLRRTLTTLLTLAALSAPLHRAAAQTRPDSVRGRVTTDSGAVIAGADVIITIAPTTNVVRQTTDSAGHYALAIPDGTGEYILYIGAAGRKPFRLRLTRTGRDSTFEVNAKLASAVTAVAAVHVEARKPHPQATVGDQGFGTSGNDRTVDGVNGALPPDLATNTDAMASLIPGLAVGAGGVSAFGMSSDANNATLNGLSYGGGDLPRDARTTTRFSTSPWDPTLGGAAGVLVRQSFSTGGNISGRTAHLTFDDPALQFSDPIAAHIGQEYSNIALSEGGTGAYVLDKLFYNYGVQVSRKTSAVASLTDLDAAALNLAGVSSDSAARLIQTLGALHVPVGVAGVSPRLVTTSASFSERIDHLLPTIPRGSTPLPTWSLTALGSYSKSDPQSLTPFAPATFAGTSTNESATLQGAYTRYFGKDGEYVNETTSALSYLDNSGAPYLSLPSGNVLIASQLADGTTGLGSLNFGGNSALARDSKAWSWELINQTDFLGGGLAALPMKFFLQSRFDGFSQSPSVNSLGTFGYASLGALAANEPSTYSRTLDAPTSSGHEWTGAAALGGTYTKGKLTLTGGARVEGNVYLNAPAENPAIQSLFGARTDHAPNTMAVLPRLGFTYQIPGSPGNSIFSSQLARTFRGPSQLRGGIGEFRGTARPALLSNAMTSTGLPGGAQRLLCTGPATPVPDWQAYAGDTAAVPSSCVNTSTFADTAPSVALLDRAWAPVESWRATLGYSKTLLGTYLSIDANYSLNLHQPGTVDLNFAGAPQFSLADEAGRPVYVSPSSIDPTTGAISTVQSRTSPAFGRVVDQVSDLRGEARQLTVYAIPNIPFRWGILTVGYTYADARAQSRGFDQSTGGDPRLVDWSPSVFTPRHTVQLGLAKQFGKWGVTTFFRAQSGLPFTPLVAGDVNGDGLSNDRAFVFNPATATDPAVAVGVQSLLTSGSAAARDCLAKQVGQVAGLNSCTGPWSATMNGGVYFFQPVPMTQSRARVSFTLQNMLGGLDELIHGENHLQGWGMTPLPDQTLLRVRGFDPNANAFLYSVNPRFGSTSLATTSVRVPFRITLDVSIDVGHSFQEQELEQNLRLRPVLVGTHAPMDSVKARYMTRNFSDFYGFMLTRLKDSLALTIDQQRQMQDERELLRLKADSIYTVLATYLVGLPDNYDRKATVKIITQAGDSLWADIYAERTFLVKLLTPGQIRLLPPPIFNMIATPAFKGRFFFGF